MLDGAVMAKVTDLSVPEAGTLPVPVQPLQAYCVPVGPDVVEDTASNICVPESNQPLEGRGESYGEETEK
jgi:hypothetical protein